MEALKKFFGISDAESQKKWLERQEYYLRKRLKPRATVGEQADQLVDRRVSGAAVIGQDKSLASGDIEMGALLASSARSPTRISSSVEAAAEEKPVSKTGRALKMIKESEPDHRLMPAMPSVLEMVVSGVKSLLQTSPAKVEEAPPVLNARSFRPGDDWDNDISDVSDNDDGQCFYQAEEHSDVTDGPPGIMPSIVEETQPLTSTRALQSDITPLHIDTTDGRQTSDEYRRAISGYSRGPRQRHARKRLRYQHESTDNRFGVGVDRFEKWFQSDYKRKVHRKKYKEEDIKNSNRHRRNRLYFTSWLITVQVVIMIVTLAVYDIAPYGFDFKEERAQVLTTSLAIETRSHHVEQNPWGGPSYEDLIHLGAKYGPCMRRDKKIFERITKEREHERDNTACCVRLDGSGCVQLTKIECDRGVYTTWLKWNRTDINGVVRSSGSVCGQDPRDCQQPESTGAQVWVDDITQWPICRERGGNDSQYLNMRYEVTGRPCCIGIQGECVMASKEECSFLDGYYHENYTLCSQVHCMKSICGLSDFLDPESPNQWYRIFTSLFLHVGLIHCLVSVIFELLVLPHFERVAGWFRITMIFMLSGIGGNIVSAYFTPYQPEVGPSGALFGLLAAVVIEVVQKWKDWEKPIWELGKWLSIVTILLLVGLLPYVDNFAHFAGFIFGLLLSVVFLPYVSRKGVQTEEELDERKRMKLIMIAVGGSIFLFLFILFFLLFYLDDDFDCTGCKYFSCVPATDTFCLDLDSNLRPRQSDLIGL